MSPASVLLKAYYERLYELMESSRASLAARIDELLATEVDRQGFIELGVDGLAAYRAACLAFVDERQESYNPIGIQYTFGRVSSPEVAELEFQLNWYNSRPEFKRLVATARVLAGPQVPDEALPQLVQRLIARHGAYPDESIIAAYAVEPALQKLPDYVVACAIEHVICGRAPSP